MHLHSFFHKEICMSFKCAKKIYLSSSNQFQYLIGILWCKIWILNLRFSTGSTSLSIIKKLEWQINLSCFHEFFCIISNTSGWVDSFIGFDFCWGTARKKIPILFFYLFQSCNQNEKWYEAAPPLHTTMHTVWMVYWKVRILGLKAF